jgi:hypothetical protein
MHICVCLFNVKNTFTVKPGDSSSRTLFKRNENICPHQELYVNSYSDIVSHSLKYSKQNVFQLVNE